MIRGIVISVGIVTLAFLACLFLWNCAHSQCLVSLPCPACGQPIDGAMFSHSVYAEEIFLVIRGEVFYLKDTDVGLNVAPEILR